MTATTIKSKNEGKRSATVGSVMRQCGLRVLLVPVGVAALVCLVLALPTITAAVQSLWYGWAAVITRDYTSVVPATLIEWTSTVLFIWAVCVASKLSKVNLDCSALFGLLAAVILLLGVEVPNCALYAVVNGWSPDEVTGWQLAGLLTNFVNLALLGIAAVFGFMFGLVNLMTAAA